MVDMGMPIQIRYGTRIAEARSTEGVAASRSMTSSQRQSVLQRGMIGCIRVSAVGPGGYDGPESEPS
jgi:hypothetical protein